MYRLAICEDEKNIREELVMLCKEILTKMNLRFEVSAFESADRLDAELSAGAHYDLLCLDIMMKGTDGMELARKLRRSDNRVSIIFITGSSDYLKEGYQVQPIQYLYNRWIRRNWHRLCRPTLRLHHEPKSVELTIRGRTTRFSLDEIRYVESGNHRIRIHLIRKGRADDIRDFPLSLSEIGQCLPQEIFCRCHNSYLVNMSHIAEIDRRGIILDDGTRVPVDHSYSSIIRQSFLHYLNNK